MPHTRPPFNGASPKMETVFTKTSIQREYMLKQSSADALNASLSSTTNEGVTSDSFFAHGFRNQKTPDLAKRNDQLDSLQSETSILNFERDIQEVTEALRNLPDVNDSSEIAARRSKVTEYQHAGNESGPHPAASKTTLFKSLYEHSQDAQGEYTAQEVSAKQAFDERGIEDVFSEKQVLAQSTKKPTSAQLGQKANDADSALGRQDNSYPDRLDNKKREQKSSPHSVFSRYRKRAGAAASRRRCNPQTWLLVVLLALLLALFVMISIFYFVREHNLGQCFEALERPIGEFCTLEQPPLRLAMARENGLQNSEKIVRLFEVRDELCSNSKHGIEYAENKTVSFFFSDDHARNLFWPTIGNISLLRPILLGEEFRLNLTDVTTEAILHLVAQVTIEKSYLEAVEKAVRVHELTKHRGDQQSRFTNFDIAQSANEDYFMIGSTSKQDNLGLTFEGSPRQLYLSLMLTTLCELPGTHKTNYTEYVRSMERLLSLMEC